MKPIWLILFVFLIFAGTASAEKKAVIKADSTWHNFGKIVQQEGKVSHTFFVKNTGDAPLVILRVIASCGCTRPEWTKTPIAPGDSGKVKITYVPEKEPGAFEKKIQVYSNGSEGSYILTIKGVVVDSPAKTGRPPSPEK